MAWYDVQIDPSGKPVDYIKPLPVTRADEQNTPANLDPNAQPPAEPLDTVTTNTDLLSSRNVAQLQAKIKQAGGTLVVNANSSEYIVAVNNGLRFSVTKLANGQYAITDSSQYLVLIVAAAAIAAILLLKGK